MLYHTENETTTTVGQATATVVLQSKNTSGDVITSVELVYPRYILAELNTHRMFSRSSCSSRATPLKVTAEEVREDPVFFDFVGKNQPGMVAETPLLEAEKLNFRWQWEALGKYVADWAEEMNERYGIHKQTLNRVLEPWLRVRTIVTATEWSNFFRLRLAPNAQPEMQSLAQAIKGAMEKSHPVLREHHFPYLTKAEDDRLVWDKARISAARCARVSYARLDGKPIDPEADIVLAEKLYSDRHMSPFEHAASATPGKNWANLQGWQSVRTLLGE